MLESYNNQDLIVRDYTDNFSVKDYVINNMIPEYFPNIPINYLNLGFVGLISEYVSQAIEDSYYTSSLMLNENFITRAILPDSIYSEAALFDLGYTFATPSKTNIALQLWTEDVIKFSRRRAGTSIFDYRLDKDTKVIIGDNIYLLDYDIIISHQYMNGKAVFEVQYDMTWKNSVAVNSNRFIKNRLFNNGWLVLFLTVQEYDRIYLDDTISDNTITTASDIELSWDNHLAGFDCVYITPLGERLPMIKKIQYTDPEVEPYLFYKFADDNLIKCTFTEAMNYFKPAFNSKIEFTLFTCHGKKANFDLLDPNAEVIVEKTGGHYEYNVETHIVARCYSGSVLGTDRKDIELLRDDVKVAYNTAKVLSTDHDLDEWFNNFAKRYDTKVYFFKRRDDPSGRLFSQFIAITNDSYIYQTNTLNIEVRQSQFDYVEASNEFIIKPGHLWKYKPGSRDTVVMLGHDYFSGPNIVNSDGKAMITDDDIQIIDENNPEVDERFMFVNPFYIKLNRIPGVSACYNYLIHDKSAPLETYYNQTQFLHFQILSIEIDRSISKTYPNQYVIKANVSPVIDETAISDVYKYVQGAVGDATEYEDLTKNNLRVLMVIKSKMLGETGYIEMKPVEIDGSGFIVFESIITVDDNLRADNTIEIIDPDMTSLVTVGPTAGRVFIDSNQSMIDFIILIKSDNAPSTPIYNDPSFNSTIAPFANMYEISNRFANDYRELQLYKPMSMMRSILRFEGSINNYVVRAELMPFIKYDVPLDDKLMAYFIQAFNEQYAAVEPVLFERLDNNCHLDLKLFNTYGKSNNYFLGDTDVLLDSVHIKVTFQVAMVDRSSYLVTANSIVNQIKDFFITLNDNKIHNVYISNLIQILENENPNLDHLKFIKINDGTPYDQYIRTKYTDISDLREDELRVYVPELLQIGDSGITLIEETQI